MENLQEWPGTTQTNRRPLLDAPAVATWLNVSEARVYEMAREKLLPVVRLGRQVRFRPEDIETWLAAGGKPLARGWRREES